MNKWNLTDEQIAELGYDDLNDFLAHQDVMDHFGLPVSKKSATAWRGQPLPEVTAVTPPTVSTTKPRVPTPFRGPVLEEDIRKAAFELQKSKIEDIESTGRIVTPEQKSAIADYTGRVMFADRDPSGEVPFAPLSWLAEKVGATSLSKALAPQELMSKEDRESQTKAYTDQAKQLKSQAEVWYDMEVQAGRTPTVSKDEFIKSYRDITANWELIPPSVDIAAKQALGLETQDRTSFTRGVAPVTGGLPGITTVTSDNKLMESGTMATFRGLGGIEAGLIEAIRYPFELAGVAEERTVVDRISKGEGLETFGAEIGKAIGGDPGEAAGYIIGLGGAVAFPGPTEFLSGAGKVAKGTVRMIPGGADLIRGIEIVGDDIGKAAAGIGDRITGGTRRLAEATGVDLDTIRAIAKETGYDPADLRVQLIARADSIPSKTNTIPELARVIDEANPQDYLKELSRSNPEQYAQLTEQWRSLGLSLNAATPVATWKRLKRDVLDSGLTSKKYIAQQVMRGRLNQAEQAGKLVKKSQVIILPGITVDVKNRTAVQKKILANPLVDKLIKQINESTSGSVTLPTDLADDIRDLGIRIPEKRSAPNTEGKVDLSSAPLSSLEANQLLTALQSKVAIDLPEVTTISELQRVATAPRPTAITDALRKAVTSVNIERTFKPEMVRPQGFLALWGQTVTPLYRMLADVKGLDPITLSVQTGLIERTAGIPNVFKATYDKHIATGASSDEAWAMTIQSPFETLSAKLGTDANEDLFVAYMSALYGGYDNVTDLFVSSNGAVGARLPNAALADFWRALYSSPIPTEGKTTVYQLVNAYKSASPQEKINVLTLMHKLLVRGELRNAIDLTPDLTKLMLEGKLGAMKPAFSLDNGAIPFLATHTNRSTTNIALDLVDTFRLQEVDRRMLVQTINDISSPMRESTSLRMKGSIRLRTDMTAEEWNDYVQKSYRYYLLRRLHGNETNTALLDQEWQEFAKLIEPNPEVVNRVEDIQKELLHSSGSDVISNLLGDEVGKSISRRLLNLSRLTSEEINAATNIEEIILKGEERSQEILETILDEQRALAPQFLGHIGSPTNEEVARYTRGFLLSNSPGEELWRAMRTQDFRGMTGRDIGLFLEAQLATVERVNTAPGSAAEMLFDTEYAARKSLNKALTGSVALRETASAFKSMENLSYPVRTVEGLTEDLAKLQAVSAQTTSDFIKQISDAIEKLPKPERDLPIVQYVIKQAFATLASGVSFGGDVLFTYVPNFIKNSLLGGSWVPNFRNQFTNWFGIPVTLGITLPGRPGNTGGNLVADYIKSTINTSKMVADLPGKWSNGLLPSITNPTTVLVETPLGVKWTSADIDEMIAEYGLDTASIRAEVREDMLRDVLAYANRLASGEKDPGLRESLRRLAKMDVQAFAAQIRKPAAALGITGLSVFNRVAQEVDLVQRKSILIENLAAGATEAEAIVAARKALFDYSDMTKFEKEYVARYVWFYRFMRQNMVQTTAALIDNPMRFARLAKIAKNIPALMGSGYVNPDMQDYRESASFIRLMEGINGERIGVYTPSQPILEATGTLVDVLGMFALINHPDSITFQHRSQSVAQKLGGNTSLILAELTAQTTLGENIDLDYLKRDSSGAYIDPTLVLYLKSMGAWDTLELYVDVERAQPSSDSVTTFNGYQYKLVDNARSKRNWTLLMLAIKTAGLGRALKDYGPMLNTILAEGTTDVRSDIATGDRRLDIMETLGIITINPTPTISATAEHNRRRVLQALGE